MFGQILENDGQWYKLAGFQSAASLASVSMVKVLSTRTVIDIHFLSIRSLTFYISFRLFGFDFEELH